MKDVAIISNEYKHYFEEKLRSAIIAFQDKGWEVEVQFTVAEKDGSPYKEYHAMVMAYEHRENPVSKG